MHGRLLKRIALEVASLEAVIAALIKATPHFAELAEIIESVPGLGRTTSAGLIAAMPELGQVSNKIAAALLGVAPYDDDSGKRRGERQIKGGRRRVRNLFYMACLGASTCAQPGAQDVLSTPDCQRKKTQGGACRLHAQADRHPQHHDCAAPEVGRQPLRVRLTDHRHRSASIQLLPGDRAFCHRRQRNAQALSLT